MKYLMILILLTGCTVDVEQWEINKAIEYCGSVSSIQFIEGDSIFNSRIYCTTGKTKVMVHEYE